MSICLILSGAEKSLRTCFLVRKSVGLQSVVYNHFGSAPAFVIVDIENNNTTTIINEAAHHPQRACTSIETLTSMQIDAIILGAVGVDATMKLNPAGIKVYRPCRGDDK
jgi:predicted Fe-Mo cluster-binding NifX family protein